MAHHRNKQPAEIKACGHLRRIFIPVVSGASEIRALTLATTLAAFALPATAQEFKPPQGCTLEVTVQNRGCTVSQIYRCEADQKGDQHTATFTENGLSYLSQIDAETRWTKSISPMTGTEDRLEENARDHASFSELIRTGRDDFDFWTRSNNGERLHHVGRDVLTGDKVTVDGVELEKTQFELVTTDEAGEVLIERKGQQFVSRTMGRFYGGIEKQSDWTGETRDTNDSPVQFSFPGEQGFGDIKPQFDCGQMLARATAPDLRISSDGT